jgi:hypothetical protein
VKIWMEHSIGQPASQPALASGKVRYFPGRAHYFIDVTDGPEETVGERPVEIVVEHDEPAVPGVAR